MRIASFDSESGNLILHPEVHVFESREEAQSFAANDANYPAGWVDILITNFYSHTRHLRGPGEAQSQLEKYVDDGECWLVLVVY